MLRRAIRKRLSSEGEGDWWEARLKGSEFIQQQRASKSSQCIQQRPVRQLGLLQAREAEGCSSLQVPADKATPEEV
jgi:hypothetical protein